MATPHGTAEELGAQLVYVFETWTEGNPAARAYLDALNAADPAAERATQERLLQAVVQLSGGHVVQLDDLPSDRGAPVAAGLALLAAGQEERASFFLHWAIHTHVAAEIRRAAAHEGAAC